MAGWGTEMLLTSLLWILEAEHAEKEIATTSSKAHEKCMGKMGDCIGGKNEVCSSKRSLLEGKPGRT